MNKKIRSVSISQNIDETLMEDSRYRGLTVSANISRILYDYFQNHPINNNNKKLLFNNKSNKN